MGAYTYLQFLDAKHYYTDGRWTLAGVCEGYELVSNSRVIERRPVNPARGWGTVTPRLIADVRRVVRLGGPKPDGRIGPDGWVRPLLLRDGIVQRSAAH